MRITKSIFLVCAMLLGGVLFSQDVRSKLDVRIAHAMPLEELLIDNGSNPLFEAGHQQRSFPFLELNYSRAFRAKFRFGVGLFAHLTQQVFSYDMIVIGDELPVLQVQHKNYRFTNFRSGLNASVVYQFGRWDLGVAIGPSFRRFTHNHNGLYVNEWHSTTNVITGVEWATHREERVSPEKNFIFDWYYAGKLSYQLHPKVKANVGLFGFGRLARPNAANKQYLLNVSADLASESGGLVTNNSIEVFQPNHFWQVGITIDLWSSSHD